LPTWLSFDPLTLTFSGTPAENNLETLEIQVQGLDELGGAVLSTFSIKVNSAPMPQAVIADREFHVGDTITYLIPTNAFSDLDGDMLTYDVALVNGEDWPEWLIFDAETQRFTGTPSIIDKGDYEIEVIATDAAGRSAIQTFIISIPNQAPVKLTEISQQQASVWRDYEYAVSTAIIEDPDGDPLTYTTKLSNGGDLPGWLTFNPATRVFSGAPNPDFWNGRAFNVRVSATDGIETTNANFNLLIAYGSFFSDLGTIYGTFGIVSLFAYITVRKVRDHRLQKFNNKVQLFKGNSGQESKAPDLVTESKIKDFFDNVKSAIEKNNIPAFTKVLPVTLEAARLYLLAHDKRTLLDIDNGIIATVASLMVNIDESLRLAKRDVRHHQSIKSRLDGTVIWLSGLKELLNFILVYVSVRDIDIKKIDKQKLLDGMKKIPRRISELITVANKNDTVIPHLWVLTKTCDEIIHCILDSKKTVSWSIIPEYIRVLLASIFGLKTAWDTYKSIPGEWYSSLMIIHELAASVAATGSEDELQRLLGIMSGHDDWRFKYNAIVLLGQLGVILKQNNKQELLKIIQSKGNELGQNLSMYKAYNGSTVFCTKDIRCRQKIDPNTSIQNRAQQELDRIKQADTNNAGIFKKLKPFLSKGQVQEDIINVKVDSKTDIEMNLITT